MERRSLLVVLNWFLALEQQQVALYRGQARRTREPHLRRALELFADIEFTHVQNLEREIGRLGGGRGILPQVAEGLGHLLGQASRVTGVVPMLKMNILIETRAARDYAGTIAKLSANPTRELLWRHWLEEELHRDWMAAYLERCR